MLLWDLRRNLGLKAAVAVAGMLAASLGIELIRQPLLQAQSADSGAPKFDVASVKASAGRGGRGGPGAKGGGSDPTLFSLHNMTLKSLILRCYGLQAYQLSGGPGWLESDRYDIDARPDGAATQAKMMLMLRTLLAERFQLATHKETRTQVVYVLTVAKGGAKFGPNFQRLKEGEPFPDSAGRMQLGGTLQNFATGLSRNMAMFDPASGPLTQRVDIPPILDRTGLAGEYSILIAYDRQEEWQELLERQLGLKLELKKEPLDMMIVDRAVKPSEN